MWKAEKSRLKYVQRKSAKLNSGLAITAQRVNTFIGKEYGLVNNLFSDINK